MYEREGHRILDKRGVRVGNQASESRLVVIIKERAGPERAVLVCRLSQLDAVRERSEIAVCRLETGDKGIPRRVIEDGIEDLCTRMSGRNV